MHLEEKETKNKIQIIIESIAHWIFGRFKLIPWGKCECNNILFSKWMNIIRLKCSPLYTYDHTVDAIFFDMLFHSIASVFGLWCEYHLICYGYLEMGWCGLDYSAINNLISRTNKIHERRTGKIKNPPKNTHFLMIHVIQIICLQINLWVRYIMFACVFYFALHSTHPHTHALSSSQVYFSMAGLFSTIWIQHSRMEMLWVKRVCVCVTGGEREREKSKNA